MPLFTYRLMSSNAWLIASVKSFAPSLMSMLIVVQPAVMVSMTSCARTLIVGAVVG